MRQEGMIGFKEPLMKKFLQQTIKRKTEDLKIHHCRK